MSTKKNVNSLVSGFQAGAMSRIQFLAEGTQGKQERAEPLRALKGRQVEPGYEEFSQVGEYEPGDRVLLPLDCLAENPNNPRVFYSESALRDLIKSIAKTGLQTAVQVYPKNAQGEHMLKSGHRRARATRVLGHTVIKAEVVAYSGDTLRDYREAREINREHKSHSLLDDAVRFKQLLDNGDVKDQQTLATMLGVTDAEVSKHLSIGVLPMSALEEMAEHQSQCGLTASYLLYRYWVTSEKDDEALLKLVRRVAEGRVTTRQLEQMVQVQKPGPAERRREHAFSRVEVSGYARGELKAFEGKLTLKLESVASDKREALFRHIVKAFEDAGLEVGGATSDANRGAENIA